jgi:hypothetical protein
MVHTPECQAGMARAEEVRADWVAQWPNYCRECGGEGLHHYPGVYRYPDGSGEPPSTDPCEGCVCQGKCSRCGAEGLDPETAEGPCKTCGWNYDDAIPAAWECGCWEDYP